MYDRAKVILSALERVVTEPESQLGLTLTAVAAAANACGFLAVGRFLSHMSGVVSTMAFHAAAGEVEILLLMAGVFALFVAGAACSAMIVNEAVRRRYRNVYIWPLILEAILLAAYGIGSTMALPEWRYDVVIGFSFLMGLQNATITTISGARMRTTHITGVVTDIGTEIGRLLYERSGRRVIPSLTSNPYKLVLLLCLVTSFFLGGVLGVLSFTQVGLLTCVPLALILAVVIMIMHRYYPNRPEK
ncbi:putative membrane spanning protein [Granulibacter bethesdensis]|uniref:Membrane spanning protein n=1 Tax=Granulibacter bethesdensis TaxID=364410 RepID=A0AAC9KCR1_9PROT|nr:YoaK family protein [Granulibacter bethesdensis]APH53550.1 putative membrane spanning protein [Granulibacter bethesdensis]APH61128.1 putative membrane spanning protein [Granulibacter bethesdensis]